MNTVRCSLCGKWFFRRDDGCFTSVCSVCAQRASASVTESLKSDPDSSPERIEEYLRLVARQRESIAFLQAELALTAAVMKAAERLTDLLDQKEAFGVGASLAPLFELADAVRALRGRNKA